MGKETDKLGQRKRYSFAHVLPWIHVTVGVTTLLQAHEEEQDEVHVVEKT